MHIAQVEELKAKRATRVEPHDVRGLALAPAQQPRVVPLEVLHTSIDVGVLVQLQGLASLPQGDWLKLLDRLLTLKPLKYKGDKDGISSLYYKEGIKCLVLSLGANLMQL